MIVKLTRTLNDKNLPQVLVDCHVLVEPEFSIFSKP